MSRVQIRVTQSPAAHRRLREVAARLSKQPATLAAELIEEGLERLSDSHVPASPTIELKRWLEPYLSDLLREGDWPPDVTVHVFELIRDRALDLYLAAAEEIGRKTLNRELGRLVKERLRARVIMRDGRPQLVKVSRNSKSLIQAASLLEPNSEEDTGQPF
jgi:predicted DNA-binding protein